MQLSPINQTKKINEVLNYLEEKKYISIQSIILEAQKHKVNISLCSKKDGLIKLQKKNTTLYIYRTNIPFKRQYSNLSKDKSATKKILNDNNISVPRGVSSSTFVEAYNEIKSKKLRYPLLIKPLDGSQAIGVKRNITTKKEFRESFQSSKIESGSKTLLIEEMFIGDEFRVLILKNKVISCVQKIPATIIGDGSSTITELIKKYNKKRKKNFKILLDKKLILQNNFSMNTILDKNQELQLNNSYFMRDGARCIEKINEMPKKIMNDCTHASKILGMDYVGLDLIKHKQTSSYVILEANPCPAHILNEAPLAENTKTNISKILLQYFFKDIK